MTEKVAQDFQVAPESAGALLEFVEAQTSLSRRKIKDVMAKGGVWVQRGKSEPRRIRRGTYLLKKNDLVQLFYDEHFLQQKELTALCIADLKQYSVWYKPPGMSVEGCKEGDFRSLLRKVHSFFEDDREVFPVHPVDVDQGELVLIAHRQGVLSKLALLFARHKVQRVYLVLAGGGLRRDKKGRLDRLSTASRPPATIV